MPLIILCGIPCSGKTQRSKDLDEYFKNTRKSILITDEDIGSSLDRNAVYSDSLKEKELRSALKSQVQRHISKETVVILDAGNYIKGYRYELYCLSKGSKTTHCVVHCDILPEDCWKFNETQPSSSQYSKEIFDALVQRFEAPESRNRWDSPLFIAHKDEKLPFEDINSALFLRKAPPPNLSTQCPPLAPTNFLYELDKVTQDIVKGVLDAQKTCCIGDAITIPAAQDKIHLLRTLSAAELSRLRRQFISYTKTQPLPVNSKIPNMFVQYVNRTI